MSVEAQFCWSDFGWWVQPAGPRRLLSWNAATKELAFWPIHRLDEPVVVAVIEDEAEVIRRLDGWQAYHESEEGLAWLARRLEGCE